MITFSSKIKSLNHLYIIIKFQVIMYHLLTQPVQRTVQKIRNFAIEENFIGKPFKVGEKFFNKTL